MTVQACSRVAVAVAQWMWMLKAGFAGQQTPINCRLHRLSPLTKAGVTSPEVKG